jgi:hypothetical protein
VDLVLRGDAEQPLLRLLEQLASDSPRLERVPNLSWRQGPRPRHNPLSYQVQAHELDALDDAPLDLLRRAERYTGHDRMRRVGEDLRAWSASPVFHLPVGRGVSGALPRPPGRAVHRARGAGWRACRSRSSRWPPGQVASREELAHQIKVQGAEVARRRGCDSCPANEACSRCPYPDPLTGDRFCELKRGQR